MINIKPTIQIYNDEGKLTRAYDKAINKMIDVTMDVDLSQFDFEEVYEGKCKEFDDLVTKLCKQSGLGSDTIYALLLTRFTDEDEYLMDYDVMYTYGLDELEESKKTARKSIKEAKNNFNLYELQNYYPFKKEWENAIKSEGFKIHEVSGDKIVFAINTDEGKFYNKLINAEIIIEDNMPIFLAKLLSWLKLDFGCSWTFGDEEEVNGYQYIDFMIW